MLKKYPVISEKTQEHYTVLIEEDFGGFQAKLYRGKTKWYSVSIYSSGIWFYEEGKWEYDFLLIVKQTVEEYEALLDKKVYAENKRRFHTEIFESWDGTVQDTKIHVENIEN